MELLLSAPVVPRGVGRAFRQRSSQARPAMARRRQPPVVAMAAGSNAGGFFRDEKKDAARRALEAALSGKKDILADVERMRGGDDGGSGGSGGGGGGWNPFNRGKDDGGAFRRESATTAQAVGAILGVLLVLTCWKPMLAIPVNLVYYTFRIPRELPQAEAAPAAATAEEDVLKRLGQDDE